MDIYIPTKFQDLKSVLVFELRWFKEEEEEEEEEEETLYHSPIHL